MNITNRSFVFLVAFVIVASASGCVTRTAFLYKPTIPLSVGPKTNSAIAVTRFADERGTRNVDYGLLGLLPLVPFAPQYYDQPEAGGRLVITQDSYQIYPGENFAQALVFDLKRSGLFSDPFYTDRDYPKEADYVIHGVVHSTRFRGKIFSYLVGPFSPYLWFVGLPVGHSTNEIDLSVQLIDVQDKRVIWENRYQRETSHVGGLYYNSKKYTAGYPTMIEEVNREIVAAIERELRK